MHYIAQTTNPTPQAEVSILTSGAFLGIVATVIIQRAIERFFPEDGKLIEILREQNSDLQESLEHNTEALSANRETLVQLGEAVRQLTTAVMFKNK